MEGQDPTLRPDQGKEVGPDGSNTPVASDKETSPDNVAGDLAEVNPDEPLTQRKEGENPYEEETQGATPEQAILEAEARAREVQDELDQRAMRSIAEIQEKISEIKNELSKEGELTPERFAELQEQLKEQQAAIKRWEKAGMDPDLIKFFEEIDTLQNPYDDNDKIRRGDPRNSQKLLVALKNRARHPEVLKKLHQIAKGLNYGDKNIIFEVKFPFGTLYLDPMISNPRNRYHLYLKHKISDSDLSATELINEWLANVNQEPKN